MPLHRDVVDPNAPGSLSSPFATVGAANAAYLAGTAPVLPWIANPLAPCGMTQACWIAYQSTFVPRPGQCVAQFRGLDGALLLDMTAAGRTPGTWYQVWSGPVIPDWLMPNHRAIGVQARLDVKESTNTGTIAVAIGLRGADTPIGDPNNSIIARSVIGSQFGNGMVPTVVSTERREGSFFGCGGLSLSGQGDRVNSSFVAGATKPVLDVNFGLVSNTLKMWYLNIWSM